MSELSVGRNGALLLTGSLFRVGAQFGLALAGATFLGLSQYGMFAAVLALTRLSAPLIESGARILYFQNESYRNDLSSDEYWWTLVVGRTVVGLLASALIAACGLWAFGVPADDGFLVGIQALPLLLLTLYKARLVALGAVMDATGVDVARAVTLLVPLLAFAGESRSLTTWAVFNAIGSVLFCVAIAVTAGLSVPGRSAAIRIGRWFASFGVGLSIGFGLLASLGSMLVDQVLLGILSDDQNVALYSLAASGAFAALLPASALAEATTPRLLASSETQALGTRYVKIVGAIMVAAALLAYPSWLIIGDLISLPDVATVGLVNAVLIVALTPRILLLPRVLQLHREMRHHSRTALEVGALAVNVTLNIVLIPLWGLWGAVVSTAVSEGCFSFGLLVYLRSNAVTLRTIQTVGESS